MFHFLRRSPRRWSAAALFAATLACSVTGAHAVARTVSQPLGTELEARAAMFVIERFLDEENELDDIKAFYGSTVFYFREGVQSLDEVMADKKAYLERWPERRFNPDLRTLRTRLIEGSDGRRDVEVRLEVDFEVAGANRRGRSRFDGVGFSGDDALDRSDEPRRRRVSRGRSVVIIVLAERSDDFIILSEGGRVISRR